MKKYIKQGIFLAVFITIAFVSTTKVADAFALNIGFGFGTQSMYGNFGNFGNYGYNVPVNCFNAGYPCNGYFGNPVYNYIPQNVQYTNMYNQGCTYNCFNNPNNMYNMSSPVYYNPVPYYDQAPVRTTGGYMQNSMYSTYNNMHSNWYGY